MMTSLQPGQVINVIATSITKLDRVVDQHDINFATTLGSTVNFLPFDQMIP